MPIAATRHVPSTPDGPREKLDADSHVAIVGSAQLGEPILAALHAEGSAAQHHAWTDRTAPSRIDISRCSVLMVCSATERDALELLGDEEGGILWSLRPGTIVVLHTQVAAEQVDELAKRCAAYGVVLVEAPVVGQGTQAWSTDPTILVGGPSHAIDAVEPMMRAWASTVVRTGGLGSATKTLLVNELLFAANAQLAGDALELGLELGLEQTALIDALCSCTSASVSLRIIQGAGTTAAFAKAAERCHSREVAAASATAKRLGADLGLTGDALARGPFALLPEPNEDS